MLRKSFFNKLKAIKWLVNINIIVKIIFIKIDIGKIENNIFLLLCLFSLTTFDIPVANPNCEIAIIKEKVGITNIYKLITSRLEFLVIITFIRIPNILVKKPPIIKIIVLLINVSFFILNNMF